MGKWHLTFSIAKSILRIVAGTALIFGAVWPAGALLILAEIGGIVEEL